MGVLCARHWMKFRQNLENLVILTFKANKHFGNLTETCTLKAQLFCHKIASIYIYYFIYLYAINTHQLCYIFLYLDSTHDTCHFQTPPS